MAKVEKIPREKVDALVAMATSAALERLERGEADEDDMELLRNSEHYFEQRKSGVIGS